MSAARRRCHRVQAGPRIGGPIRELHHDHHDRDHHDHDYPPGGGSHFSDLELSVKALEYLLVEKGLVDPAALDALIDTYEMKVGPRNGARVVARAWVDPKDKRRLLADANVLAARRAGARQALGRVSDARRVNVPLT